MSTLRWTCGTAALWLCAGISAQPGPAVSVVFSHQPLETFKAAFLSKLPSVALYTATACNTDWSTTGTVSTGFLLQAAGTAAHIGLVDRSLVEATVNRAKHRSKKYMAAEIALWASLVGGAVIPGGMVYTIAGYKIAPAAILGLVSKKMSDTWAADQGTDTSTLRWLDGTAELKLTPRACVSGLFLGTWDAKTKVETASAVVTAVAVR